MKIITIIKRKASVYNGIRKGNELRLKEMEDMMKIIRRKREKYEKDNGYH